MNQTNSKKSKFFLTAALAAIVGAVGGLLLAPKSGKETRKDLLKLGANLQKKVKSNANEAERKVRKVFGKVTTDARNKYDEIQKKALNKVAAVKKAGQGIDKEKYSAIVDEIIEEFKDDFKSTKGGAKKMAFQLKSDWDKIRKALV